MRSLRCSLCSNNYPPIKAFETCPVCSDATSPMQAAPPMSEAAANRIVQIIAFEKEYGPMEVEA